MWPAFERGAGALWLCGLLYEKKHDEQLRKVAWETFQMAKEEKRLEELPLFKPEVAAHSEL